MIRQLSVFVENEPGSMMRVLIAEVLEELKEEKQEKDQNK